MSEGQLLNAPADVPNLDLSRTRSGGKVVHDSRGNAIWDWAAATGVTARRSAAELIRMLDQSAVLALKVELDSPAAEGWGGDPYNRPARNSKAAFRR